MAIIHPQVEMLLFRLNGANMNSTADQPIIRQFACSSFLITRIRMVDASLSLTTAVGGIYTGASKTGVTVVSAAQAYSALTGATLGMDLTVAPAGLDRIVSTTLFLSLTTPQGAAAATNLYVLGVPLT